MRLYLFLGIFFFIVLQSSAATIETCTMKTTGANKTDWRYSSKPCPFLFECMKRDNSNAFEYTLLGDTDLCTQNNCLIKGCTCSGRCYFWWFYTIPLLLAFLGFCWLIMKFCCDPVDKT